jgi:hypothetical protein
MSASGTVRARWVPLWGADLADGTHIEHGQEYTLPAAEAEASENWQPVKAPRPALTSTPDVAPKDEE